jgi:phosphate transport system permease protein
MAIALREAIRTRSWRQARGTGRIGNRVFAGLLRLLAVGVALLVLLIALEILDGAQFALARFGPAFLFGTTWDPVREEFGALPFVYGTLATSALALLLGGPIGLAAAIFLAELAPDWLRGPVSALVELLAAIPSVVYGLWGIFVLVPLLRTVVQPTLAQSLGFLPFFQGPAYGVGFLAGGIILGIMIVPTIAAVSRDALRAVPDELRQAMLALGATRWEVITTAVVPVARPGIVGALILGLGRALGETMAVTMVIGNRPQISASLFSPGYTMAAVIANEFTEATSTLYLSALMEIGLVLLLVTLLVNALARLLVWRVAWGPVGG